MAVQPGYQRFDQVGFSLLPAIIHGAADGEPAGHRIVAVHHLAGDTEGLAAIDDVALAVLGVGGYGDAVVVVHGDDQDRELVAGPGAPDHAGGKIALGGSCIAAAYDGDAVPPHPLLAARR